MTLMLAVPIHVDALVLTQPREVAGPALDVTRAPWFGAGRDDVVRDHFPQTANVAGAVRHEPLSPTNRFLQPGIHLHWALPDALCHGTTTPPGSEAYVDRDGLWFPQVPNRWLVVRSPAAGKPANGAWLIESDATHAWGAGLDAAAYPVSPTGDWPHPFIRLGRQIDLMARDRAPYDAGPKLADLDAPLTAVGPVDPTFAALYTAVHSIFGMHDGVSPTAKQHWQVFGWYGPGVADPLRDWLAQPGDTATDVAETLSRLIEPIAPDAIGALEQAQQKARAATLADQRGWTLSGKSPDLGALRGMVLYGTVNVGPDQPDARPSDVRASTAVGASPREAVSALIAAQRKMPGLEVELEAMAFADALSETTTDTASKLAENRHADGFVVAHTPVLWSLRPASDPTHATDDEDRTQRRAAILPGHLGHLLNQVNAAEEMRDRAEIDASDQRQSLFSDWQIYMLSAYPEDERVDFAMDIDLLRDGLLPRAMAACQAAETRLAEATSARDAQHEVLEKALSAWNKAKPQAEHLMLTSGPGPRYWRPVDPSIAAEAEGALEPTLRHGQDGRARKDGLLECIAVDIGAWPDATKTITSSRLAGFTKAIDAARTKSFDAIANYTQQAGAWNAILIEWQAMVHPAQAGTNLRASSRRFDPDVLLDHYALPHLAADLAPKKPDHYSDAAPGHRVSGRALLTRSGAEITEDAVSGQLDRINATMGSVQDETRVISRELRESLKETIRAGLDDDPAPHVAAMTAREQDLNRVKSLLGPIRRRMNPVLAQVTGRSRSAKNKSIVSITLGGLIDRLLMRRAEPQLPIADPLGFEQDQVRAAEVRRLTGPAARLMSPDPAAPFLPLGAARLELLPGRLIDSFGQFTPWQPRGVGGGRNQAVVASMTVRDPIARPIIPPRLAQGARLDFRWLSAQLDEVEANDHPATTPLCGWLVPNDFDQNVLVYDAAGTLLGLVDRRGTWRPAPGDPNAPRGPGLIGNGTLARLVDWLTTRSDEAFTAQFLSIADSALSAIDPDDHATHGSRALMVARPIAVARARIGISALGALADDRSGASYQRRIAGQQGSNHGLGDVKIPIRIGEFEQLNDGLVGYFVDQGGPLGRLNAPQSSTQTLASADVSLFNAEAHQPLTLEQPVQGAPQDLVVLFDPRCPVHATCGVLPSKSIRLPRPYYAAALDGLEMLFSGMPVLGPNDGVHLPLPSEPGHRWSWLSLENGRWAEVPADPVLTLAALQRAIPGAVEIDVDGTMVDLPPGGKADKGKRRIKADQLWDDLVAYEWLEPLTGRQEITARLAEPAERSLGRRWPDTAAIERLIAKLIHGIKPAERHAVFGPRLVAREGWLKLTPTATTDAPDEIPTVAPPPVRPFTF